MRADSTPRTDTSRRAIMGGANADKLPRRGRILVSAEQLATLGGKRPDPVETFFAVSKAVGSGLGLAEVLRQTTRALVCALGADIGSVWRLEARDRQLLPVAGYRVPKGLLPALCSPTLLPTRAFVAAVRAKGGAVCSSDSAKDSRFQVPFLRLIPHRSVLLQPLRVQGRTAGVFAFIWTRTQHRFSPVELRLVEAITQQATIAIENAELLGEVRQFTVRLETRVRDRTARLTQASKALRSSRAALRALTAHIEGIREHERTRIAREIHDELGQALTGLKIDLARATDDAAIRQLTAAVDEMIATVRRIATELRPQILDDLGLLAALEWQTQEFARRTGIKCHFRCTGGPNGVDVDRTTALFRIFQEILTNVARHADATRVQITLDISPSSVRLDVRDNGKGIGSKACVGADGSTRLGATRRSHQCLGLLGMQERANGFGGRVVIASVVPHGTRVRVRIPRPGLALRGR